MQAKNDSFKDPSRLTKWTKWLLYAQIIISIVAVISGCFEYKLLSQMQNEFFGSMAQLQAAAEANDQRQEVIGIMQFVIMMLLFIMYLRWVYRANFNVRQLGAQQMKITPRWSVGWYFVPIFGLWKPYVAMKEIWRASLNPEDWESQRVPAFLGWWWFLWVISTTTSTQSVKLSFMANNIPELVVANIVTLISDAIEIPLALIMIVLISKVYKMQMMHYQESLVEQQSLK